MGAWAGAASDEVPARLRRCVHCVATERSIFPRARTSGPEGRRIAAVPADHAQRKITGPGDAEEESFRPASMLILIAVVGKHAAPFLRGHDVPLMAKAFKPPQAHRRLRRDAAGGWLPADGTRKLPDTLAGSWRPRNVAHPADPRRRDGICRSRLHLCQPFCFLIMHGLDESSILLVHYFGS